jgi:hypothetical protein
MGLPPKEWPMCTRRYAATSAQSQRERSRSREAMTAWRPKSRAGAGRSRLRAGGAGRALTGQRRSGSGAPSGHGSACLASRRSQDQWSLTTRCLSMRGARIRDFAWACGKSHAAGRKRTSLQDTDIPAFFSSPTGAHLAPFILPSLGRRSPHRRSCAALRQIAIRQKPDQAPREQIPRMFVAVDMSSLW